MYLQVGQDWGSIRVQGKGRGAGVLQLTSSYYVAEEDLLTEAPERAFSLKTHASASGRNASTLRLITCVRWLYTTASDSSGVTVLEIAIPTGYVSPPGALEEYVMDRKVAHLRRADYQPRKATFFFDKVRFKPKFLRYSLQN